MTSTVASTSTPPFLPQPAIPSSSVWVTSEAQAAVLRDLGQVRLLCQFMNTEGLSVQTFAQAVGWPPLRAYRKVRAFEALGLVEVVRSQRRAGRPTRLYICRYQRFLLPSHLYSMDEYLSDTFRPHEEQLRRELARAVEQAPRAVKSMAVGIFGNSIGVVPADREGVPWCDWEDAMGGTPLYFNLGTLHLNYADAKALQLELMEVFDRYGRKGGAARYLFQAALTPSSGGEPPVLERLSS